MRFIGGKSLLLENIYSIISSKTKNVHSILDLFSGSGIVSKYFKNYGFKIFSNDLLYFSFVLTRGSVGINKIPKFKLLGIDNPINYLNNLKINDINLDSCFIYKNYSLNENCNKMYFQKYNAIKIDGIRQKIEEWKNNNLLTEDEYYYLLASLIMAVPYVSNITGTYGSYLKTWDKRSYKNLELKEQKIIEKEECRCFCGDYSKVVNLEADILYADPPYNSREYLPNYHILETIARYDYPKISGITGMREYKNEKSVFCKKKTVLSAFEKLLSNSRSKYILISYNNEGLISTETLTELCKKYAKSFQLFEYPYRRYKSKFSLNNSVKEQIYFLQRN